MALPLPPGLTHSEVAFLAEMEMVTVVPRQRLESIDLLSGQTPPLRPPHRAQLPLWLALLLKKQRRANIVPPPWLHPASLADIIHRETKGAGFSAPPPPPARANPHEPGRARRFADDDVTLSPPFQPSCTANAPAGYLPYHWLEVAESLLTHAGDDMAAPVGEVRSLLRDLVEVRAAKMRDSISELQGLERGMMLLTGVGSIELAESRGFVLGVVDGVRKIGASTEATRRDKEEMGDERDDEGSDDDMGI